MIYHIFNSSLISGPETLVLPALASLKSSPVKVILLRESRISQQKQSHVQSYVENLGLPCIIVDVQSRLDRQAIEKLRAVLEEARDSLEIIHAHDVKASFYLLMASRRLRSRRFSMVSTHHGVDGRTGFINRAYELFYSYKILPQYDRVLTVCTQDQTSLLKRGLQSDLVRVHLNGVTREMVSEEARQQRQAEIRKSWGLDSSGENMCVIGVAARLEGEKRPFEILEIAKKVRELDSSFAFQILFFGRGSLEESLKRKTKELGLEETVRWMGYRSGLGEEFAGFDLLLSLSKAEGLPINLLEAGWSGTPIFATAVHGVNDLISSAELGTLVKVDEAPSHMAEKLLALARNKKEMQQKGRAFQQHVAENFSQEVWLNKLLQFYTELRNKKFSGAAGSVSSSSQATT